MITKIGKRKSLDKACELIKQGEVVAFATETVYGLGADAFNLEAVAKIFKAKGRPQDNPLIVHISNLAFLDKVAREVPEQAYALFEKFSPGPLTIVLKKNKNLPDCVTAGLDTVGVRIPDHKMALALIEKTQTGICAPSANTSSRLSPTTANHVYEDLKGKIPLILDGGECSLGIESTVLDLTESIPTILRPGTVTEDMLADFLGSVITHKGELKQAKSPGMKYRHYAPLAKTLIASSPEDALTLKNQFTDKRVVIIGSDKFIRKCNEGISLGNSPKELAKNFYKELRQAEKNYDVLIIEQFENIKENAAVLNRLLKAVSLD